MNDFNRAFIITLITSVLFFCIQGVVFGQDSWCYEKQTLGLVHGSDGYNPKSASLGTNHFAIIETSGNIPIPWSRLAVYSRQGLLTAISSNPSPTEYSEGFHTISALGSSMMVGSLYGPSRGAAAVFNANNGSLIRLIPCPSNETMGVQGYSVAVAGTNAILLAAWNGSVHLYNLLGERQWSITNPAPVFGGQFSRQMVVISSNRIAVSDFAFNESRGRIYLYDFQGHITRIIDNPSMASSGFGFRMSSIGSNQFAAATFTAGNNSVYIFDGEGNQLAVATNPSPANYSFDVETISASGPANFLVGNPFANQSKGLVHLFDLEGKCIQTFTNPLPATTIYFGSNLAGFDGRGFFVSAFSLGFIYSLGKTDCNGDGECDPGGCGEPDCDADGIPDSQEPDCNSDGIPDSCESCPDMDVVFILDTSGSMGNAIQNLCDNMPAVIADLASRSININYTFLSIVPQRSVSVSSSCFDGNIAAMLGTNVPGSNPGLVNALSLDTVSNCTRRISGQATEEDWGPATAVIASKYPWANGRTRLVVPVTDTHPSPLWTMDYSVIESNYWLSISNAINVARANNVIVSPVMTLSYAQAYADALAAGTHGRVYTDYSNEKTNVWRVVLQAVQAACSFASDCDADGTPDDCEADCDGNGNPDDCEIALNPSLDCDRDGVLDVCAIVMGRVKDDNCDGIPDGCQGSNTAFRITLGAHIPLTKFEIDENGPDCKARVYIPVNTTNGCPPVALSCNFTGGAFTNGLYSRRYPEGQHLVEITATDARGRKTSASTTVSITDKMGPRLVNP